MDPQGESRVVPLGGLPFLDDLEYVFVKDSYNDSNQAIDPANSVDGGNTFNWFTVVQSGTKKPPIWEKEVILPTFERTVEIMFEQEHVALGEGFVHTSGSGAGFNLYAIYPNVENKNIFTKKWYNPYSYVTTITMKKGAARVAEYSEEKGPDYENGITLTDGKSIKLGKVLM